MGNLPENYWQIDFSELPQQNGYRYLLVLVNMAKRFSFPVAPIGKRSG